MQSKLIFYGATRGYRSALTLKSFFFEIPGLMIWEVLLKKYSERDSGQSFYGLKRVVIKYVSSATFYVV